MTSSDIPDKTGNELDDDLESFDIHDDQQWSSRMSFGGDRKWLRNHYVMNRVQITQKYLFLLAYNVLLIINQFDSVEQYILCRFCSKLTFGNFDH